MREILVNSVKSGLFGHSKRQNSAVFQESDLKLSTHIHRQVFLYIYSAFLDSNIFLKKWEKRFFAIFFQNFKNFKI